MCSTQPNYLCSGYRSVLFNVWARDMLEKTFREVLVLSDSLDRG
jgi:hypothetical protein